MSACTGMTGSIYTLESVLSRGAGGGSIQRQKQSGGVRGRHIHCVTEGVKINAAQAKLFHCWCRV